MEDFSALKYTVIAELFFVTIYTQMFAIWFNRQWSKR